MFLNKNMQNNNRKYFNEILLLINDNRKVIMKIIIISLSIAIIYSIISDKYYQSNR